MHTTNPTCLEIHLGDCTTKSADNQLRELAPGQRILAMIDMDTVVATGLVTPAGDPVWVTEDGRIWDKLDDAEDHFEECQLAPLDEDAEPHQVLANELHRIVNLLHKVCRDNPRNGYPLRRSQDRLRAIVKDLDYAGGIPNYQNARQRRAQLGEGFHLGDFGDVDF